jgi:hypothetical protein
VSADFSVAPEIAQLATVPVLPAPLSLAPGRPGPATAGRRAAELTRLAASPTRWWDLVRFDPAAVVRVDLPSSGAWLLVIPPGAAASCDCGLATLLAGEAAEDGRPLRPGRVLLHGIDKHGVEKHGTDGHDTDRHGIDKHSTGKDDTDKRGHRTRASAHGYAVSLHC